MKPSQTSESGIEGATTFSEVEPIPRKNKKAKKKKSKNKSGLVKEVASAECESPHTSTHVPKESCAANPKEEFSGLHDKTGKRTPEKMNKEGIKTDNLSENAPYPKSSDSTKDKQWKKKKPKNTDEKRNKSATVACQDFEKKKSVKNSSSKESDPKSDKESTAASGGTESKKKKWKQYFKRGTGNRNEQSENIQDSDKWSNSGGESIGSNEFGEGMNEPRVGRNESGQGMNDPRIGSNEFGHGMNDPQRGKVRSLMGDYVSPHRQWFNRGYSRGQHFHRGSKRFWQSQQWDSPWMERGRGDSYFQRPSQSWNQTPYDFSRDSYQEQFIHFGHEDHGNQFHYGQNRPPHFQGNPQGSSNFGPETIQGRLDENRNRGKLQMGNTGSEEDHFTPKRERSLSLNLDDHSKPPEPELPLPKKDNSNVSLKAMQIINQIVNKKAGKIGDSRCSQSSSVDSDHADLPSVQEQCKDVKTLQSSDSSKNPRTDKKSDNTSKHKTQVDGNRFTNKWQEIQQGGHQRTSSMTWQSSVGGWKLSDTWKDTWKDTWRDDRASNRVEQDCQYSEVSPQKSRIGSRSLSESHAEDVNDQLTNLEKHSRPGNKIKVNLAKVGKKSASLSKDYLTKLVNSPRSRKEQIQVAKMLQSHVKQHRPTVHKPQLPSSEQPTSEQGTSEKDSNMRMEDLPDDIRHQISQLIEMDMVISDEEPVNISSDIIALSSHDEEDEDDLDLIMMKDSPPPSPNDGKEKVKTDADVVVPEVVIDSKKQKQKAEQKVEASSSHILIEDSDDGGENSEPIMSGSSRKRRRSASDSDLPFQLIDDVEAPGAKKKKKKRKKTTDEDQEVEPPNVLVIKPDESGLEEDKSSNEAVLEFLSDPTKNTEEFSPLVPDHKQGFVVPLIIEKDAFNIETGFTSATVSHSEEMSIDHPVEIVSSSPARSSLKGSHHLEELVSPVKNEARASPTPVSKNTEKKEEQPVSPVPIIEEQPVSPVPIIEEQPTVAVNEPKSTDTVQAQNKLANHLPSLTSALLPPLVTEVPLPSTSAVAEDCMDQMLELSLREEVIHKKLAEVNKAVEKLQSLLKKTKDQLQRRVKQRDMLVAEEDELRTRRICLLKGAVEKRATPKQNVCLPSSAATVAVSEISSSTEAGTASEMPASQVLPRKPEASLNPLPSLQTQSCDNNSAEFPNSAVRVNDETVMPSSPEVPTKKETIEPDSTSLIPTKEPKPDPEAPSETLSPSVVSPDVLNKLKDSKGLKYLGSLSVKDSLMIKSMACDAKQKSPKIYTLSSSDQLVPLNMNTEGSPGSKLLEQFGLNEEKDVPESVKPAIAIKVEEPELEWENLLKEMQPSDLASMGITDLQNSDAESLAGKEDSEVPKSGKKSEDSTKKSQKLRKSPRRKCRSESLKTATSVSTDEQVGSSPTKRKSQRNLSRKRNTDDSGNEPSSPGTPEVSHAEKDSCLSEITQASEIPGPEAAPPSEEDLRFSETKTAVPQRTEMDLSQPTVFEGHLHSIHDMVIWENWLITASEDQTIIRFDLDSCKIVKKYEGHSKGVRAVRVLPPNSKVTTPVICSGSYDNSVKLWDFETGEQTDTWAFAHRVHCMDLNWDRMYIGLGNGHIICYSLTSHRLMNTFYCSKVAISTIKTTNEGSRRILVVASNDCFITIRDAVSGLLLRSLDGHCKVPLCLQVANPLVYSGGCDQTLQVHDLNNGELMKCFVQKRIVTSLVLDDDKIFVGGHEEVVKCYDVKTWNVRYIICGAKKGIITSLLLRDGKLFIARKNGSLECVTLVEEAKFICKFGHCLTPLTSVADLIVHVNDFHILPNQNIFRCLWNDCSQYISKNKDAISHMKQHVSAEYGP